MPQVTFLPENVTVQVTGGETVLDAALENEIELDHNCGGNCVCSTCHVVVEQGFDTLNEKSEDEEEMLDELENQHETSRLSCQCIVTDDLVVRIPPAEAD